MSLKFYIRHHDKFLQDKMILVFKSEEARDYFQQVLKDSHFEEITSEEAHQAIRIGINGKILPYGYTYKLSKEEMVIHTSKRRVNLVSSPGAFCFKHIKNR